MVTRRDFLKMAGLAIVTLPGCDEVKVLQTSAPSAQGQTLVNDIHSQLNPTWVDQVVEVDSLGKLQQTIEQAGAAGKSISIAGGRHAMGGQQFGTDTILIDTRRMNRVLDFDRYKGTIEVEAGLQWPELIDFYLKAQQGDWPQWGIAQKQTGADRLGLGGALSANVHGRGLSLKPFVEDVESFQLVDARGNVRECGRTVVQDRQMFSAAVGGYGLFGPVYSIVVRLVPRQKLERVVELISIDGLMDAFDDRIVDGFTYGDFQYMTDETSEDFMRKGVFSCYRPVADDTPIPEGQARLSGENWANLITLGHIDKRRAYELYSSYYLSTSGQIYWSDTHQMSFYLNNYHDMVDAKTGAWHEGTEMITEIYVPRQRLAAFMAEARADFLANGVNVIYGTVRLIEEENTSFLNWARQPYACIIFNLHILHTEGDLARNAEAFRRLIDLAISFGGSYYLTYHKFARRDQVETCYPQFESFLKLKQQMDPEERFASDWYRHYKEMFA